MEITFTEYQINTLLTAIEYFDLFQSHELPVEESEWTSSEKRIDEINDGLDDIYYILENTKTIILSAQQASYLLSALSVYQSIVANNIKTNKKSNFTQAEQFTLQSDIKQLYIYLHNVVSELDTTVPIQTYEVQPGSEYL